MESFDWKSYIANYPDLKHLTNLKSAWQHYTIHGKSEGRTPTLIKPTLIQPTLIQPINLQPLITLNSKIINLSETINFPNVSNNLFYSSNISIIKVNDTFIINSRFVNYRKGEFTPVKCISLNKCIILDTSFKIISEKIFDHNLLELSSTNNIGVEDIKLFYFENKIYYIGNYVINNKSHITTGIYDPGQNNINIKVIQSIYPQKTEKNWCYFENNNKLNLVYSWCPLLICEIVNFKLILIKQINNSCLKNVRGSTNGYKYNKETWFITHTNNNGIYNHQFVVFNENKIKYSNCFKFENYNIEFCLGLIISETHFIISYSLNDLQSKIMMIPIESILSIPFIDFPI